MTIKKFPENIFPIVEAEDFDKNTKTKFSEDFVEENFRSQGWNVYEPFVDKGYDRVITKEIDGKLVTRFLQIKTRRLELDITTTKPNTKEKLEKYLKRYNHENTSKTKSVSDLFYIDWWKEYSGYTIRPKDIVTDPRVVFIIFCDSKDVEDFLIFPINKWIDFMKENNSSLFSSLGFKQGDGKFNDTFYHRKTDKWTWKWKGPKSIPLDNYVNENGLKLLEDINIEKNFENLKNNIAQFKNSYIYNLVLVKKLKELDPSLVNTAEKINEFINIKNLKKSDVMKIIKSNNKIINQQSSDVIKSIKSYFTKEEQKILEI